MHLLKVSGQRASRSRGTERRPQPSKSGGETGAWSLGLGSALPRPAPLLARSTWDRALAEASAPLPRKEVIQPHLPVRLPCYDFVPIAGSALDGCPLAVGPPASGVSDFHDVTGGVYKARERIHRSVLTCGY